MKYEPKPNAFSIPVRIYYEDTDAGGVVYYANYLKFFERCRTEWMRQVGHDQSQLATEAGIAFMARKASCEYLKPARLDDQLTVGLEVEKLTRVRVVFRQHVRRGDEEATGDRGRRSPCGCHGVRGRNACHGGHRRSRRR